MAKKPKSLNISNYYRVTIKGKNMKYTDEIEKMIKEIGKEPVGYRVRARNPSGPFTTEILTLKDLILPYAYGAKSLEDVYDRLEKKLNLEIEQQNFMIGGPTFLDVALASALEREAIGKAMGLIKHYLENR